MVLTRNICMLILCIASTNGQSYGLKEEQFSILMESWRRYKSNQCVFEPPEGYLKLLPPKSFDQTGQQVPLQLQHSFQVYRLYEVDDFDQTLELQFNIIRSWKDEGILKNGKINT